MLFKIIQTDLLALDTYIIFAGDYFCFASNEAGTDELIAPLNMGLTERNLLPQLQIAPDVEEFVYMPGDTVTLECFARNAHSVDNDSMNSHLPSLSVQKIQWAFRGLYDYQRSASARQTLNGEGWIISNSSGNLKLQAVSNSQLNLILESIEDKHEGEYACNVSNNLGFWDERVIFLRMRQKGKILFATF